MRIKQIRSESTISDKQTQLLPLASLGLINNKSSPAISDAFALCQEYIHARAFLSFHKIFYLPF